MRVLVACEESQVVCKAFRARGHEAYSCDIQECSGGHPEWHIIEDVSKVLIGGYWDTQLGFRIYIERWDLLIGFPPCTYISAVQLFRMKDNTQRQEEKKKALRFFLKLWNCGIDKICLENPVGAISTELGIKQSQNNTPLVLWGQ